MKGNALTLCCFLLGIAVGLSGLSPEWLLDAALPSLLLSLLILQVGVGLGANDDLRGIVRSLRLRMLLLPLFTIAGSLLFSAAAALLPGNRPLAECLAVGSGFGYYSLSSVLIADVGAASLPNWLRWPYWPMLSARCSRSSVCRSLPAGAGVSPRSRLQGSTRWMSACPGLSVIRVAAHSWCLWLCCTELPSR